MPFLLLVSIVIIHELGHFLTAFLLKVKVDKIYLYPFGGISKFYFSFNDFIWKEFLILIMGPIFQMIWYFVLTHLSFFSDYYLLIRTYHYSILFFNLLPIYPLDGGKLFQLFLSCKFSFKRSFLLSISFSYLMVFCFSFYLLIQDFSLNIIIIITFLIYKVREESKKKDIMMNQFLLERYLHAYHFKKYKIVKNVDEFMRNYTHLVKKGRNYHTEREALAKKFRYKC